MRYFINKSENNNTNKQPDLPTCWKELKAWIHEMTLSRRNFPASTILEKMRTIKRSSKG